MSYYDSIASSYDRLHKEEQVRKLKTILPHITVLPHHALLDVGCGTGVAFPFFNCSVKIGVDPAGQLLRRAPKLSQVVHAAGEAIPLRNGTFDIILCLTAFHNFTDHQKGLEEMKRVARPDAIFIITILKKIAKAQMLGDMIKSNFTVIKELDDLHDNIYICKNIN